MSDHAWGYFTRGLCIGGIGVVFASNAINNLWLMPLLWIFVLSLKESKKENID